MRIAFVSSGKGSRPHFASLTPLIPADVDVEYKGLELYGDSLYASADKKQEILRKIQGFVTESRLDGVMVTGAPTEVLNPGLMVDLRAAFDVPVTTALNASIKALTAFSATRVLLLTPFEERLNGLIRQHLENAGVTAVAPRPFKNLEEAIKLEPGEVRELARKATSDVGDVDAVYFQGAVLDPLKVLDEIEKELRLPVVASNPAMLWYILSELGLSYTIAGYGRLLKEWPAVPAQNP
jgi:maleate cis-trans isomerase